MIRCTACKDPLPSVGFVTCAGCDGGFHFGCCGLSRSTWNSKGATKKLAWRCKYCRQASKGRNVPAGPSAVAGASGAPIHSRQEVHGPRSQPTEAVDTTQDTTTSTHVLFHATLASLRRHCRVIPRIPKGARIPVAEQLTTVIVSTVSNNDEASWRSLLLFSFAVFARPLNVKRVSLTTHVKNNLTTFAEGRGVPEVASPEFRPARRSTDLPKRAQAKLADGDVKGAVRLLYANRRD